MGRHTQQGSIYFLAFAIAQFNGVFLLIERQRTVATQLYADGAVVVACLHVGRYFLLSIQW